MSDEEIESILKHLEESHQISCDGLTLDLWRDFDSEETRLRKPGGHMVRVDEEGLYDFVNEQGGAITEERIKKLLCAIHSRPTSYPGVVVYD